MYRKELHNLIGEPDLKTFKGAADMVLLGTYIN